MFTKEEHFHIFWFLIWNHTIPISIQCKAWRLCTFRPQSSCVFCSRKGERVWLEWLRACNSVTLVGLTSRRTQILAVIHMARQMYTNRTVLKTGWSCCFEMTFKNFEAEMYKCFLFMLFCSTYIYPSLSKALSPGFFSASLHALVWAAAARVHQDCRVHPFSTGHCRSTKGSSDNHTNYTRKYRVLWRISLHQLR